MPVKRSIARTDLTMNSVCFLGGGSLREKGLQLMSAGDLSMANCDLLVSDIS